MELPDYQTPVNSDAQANTTGAITLSPDGEDVYVGSDTVCCDDDEAWLTGFPVAAVSSMASATPPTAPSITVDLGADSGSHISIAMSPDNKTLVAAMPQSIAHGRMVISGTTLDVAPVISGGAGVITAPTVDGLSCPTGTSCSPTAALSPSQSTFLPTGIPASPQGIAITPDQSPIASFTYPLVGTVGIPMAFDAGASKVQFGSITSYNWAFGDGSSVQSLGPTPTHTYSSAGTYPVTLCETDSASVANFPPGSDPITGTSFTVDGPGQTPYWDASVCANNSVTVMPSTPSIATRQQPATATAGSSVADQATVTGGADPTGTVTFNLYDNPDGTGTPLFIDTETALRRRGDKRGVTRRQLRGPTTGSRPTTATATTTR